MIPGLQQAPCWATALPPPFAGLLGGPANTTYGENTGVLELSKVYDPTVIRLAAVYAIILSFIPEVLPPSSPPCPPPSSAACPSCFTA